MKPEQQSKSTIYDLIINLVNAVKNSGMTNDKFAENLGSQKIQINNANYVLGQLIRNINVPANRIFISEAAQKLWAALTDEPIENYWYRKKVVVKSSDGAHLSLYKGASKTPYNKSDDIINKGESFLYNDVFHDDHIIPIKVILDELKKPEILTYEYISDVLDHIYICRLLKDEDHKEMPKSDRPYNVIKVVENIYAEFGISVVNWQEIKRNLE